MNKVISVRVVAILETMWDWRGMTSGAGRRQAPRYFLINPNNYSGRRLYSLVGPDAQLLVTNACKELVDHASKHGKGDPVWLLDNLMLLDGRAKLVGDDIVIGNVHPGFDVLLVCGKVAQETYRATAFNPRRARVINIPHPAARGCWDKATIASTADHIQSIIGGAHEARAVS